MQLQNVMICLGKKPIMHTTDMNSAYTLNSLNVHESVGEGTTEVQKVKRDLKHYVQQSLCADVKHDLTDCAYSPTSTDVHNHLG